MIEVVQTLRMHYLFKVKHSVCPLSEASLKLRTPIYVSNLYSFNDKSYFTLRVPKMSNLVYRMLRDNKYVKYVGPISSNRALLSVVKDSFGVLKAIADVKGFLMGPVVISKGYKNFLVLLSKKQEAKRLAKTIIKNSPVDVSLKYKRLDREDFMTIYSMLGLSSHCNKLDIDERLIETVKIAYSLGYYNWPKNASLREVAKRMKLSMVSTLRRLRAAEKAIIESYLTLLKSYEIAPSLLNRSRSFSE